MTIFFRYSISDKKLLLLGMSCLSALVFLLFKMVIISLVSKDIFLKSGLVPTVDCRKHFFPVVKN